MGFFSSIRGPIKSVLSDIMGDQDLNSVVTYKKYTGQAFDDTLGRTANTYTELEVTGVKLRHTFKSMQMSQHDVQVNDDLFMFDFEDIAELWPLSTKDQIVGEDGEVYKIKAIDDIFELAVSVTVEGG